MTETSDDTPNQDPGATGAPGPDQGPGASGAGAETSGAGPSSSALLDALVAVGKGDFSKRLPVDETGVTGKIYDELNGIIDKNENQAKEFVRIAEAVGRQGRLSQRVAVGGVTGGWADSVTTINALIDDLARPSMEIARVVTAVANGDLSQKMTMEIEGRSLAGEFLQTANQANTMVDQLSSFASEVTRVALEVGTEGALGGQAVVEDVSGTWRDLTESVNTMASNLTDQVRDIAQVTTAVAQGDLSRKITVEVRGEIAELKNTINTMVDQLSSFASEVTRVAREVGTEGTLGGQAVVEGVSGSWRDLTENVNTMANSLTDQVRDIAEVTTAVAQGDLSRKITVEVRGEILELKNTMNTMVDQLGSFASEVTRVAREVGTEGNLGGQAVVEGVSGSWRDLTENVNTMASNLTDQVRGIIKVASAVAKGDLAEELRIEARGEVADLGEVMNGMIRMLSTFSEQVTSVAREVGIEGRLGGQAQVPSAEGTWQELTDNVNELASNLTTQVRAISDVVTAVTEGDLSLTINVEARGEVEALALKINQMITTLAETANTNVDQDWLKTSLGEITRLTTGATDLGAVTERLLQELAPMISAQHAVVYMAEAKENEPLQLKLSNSYAYKQRKHISNVFRLGEGLVGQCAAEKARIMLTDVPGDYVQISSGLGEATPLNLVLLPVLFEKELLAVIELASFSAFTPIQVDFLDELSEVLGIGFNAIRATQQNEELLAESQTLTEELQSQQEELTQTNEELEEKARLVEDQKQDVERKNQEVEAAKANIEEKASELELTSRYKSEFLANMSHELRTPLNSLLILAQTLSDNPDGNLASAEVEYAQTIRASGEDLLSLINEILDLSKIESGNMAIEVQDVAFAEVRSDVERNFRQVANEKGLGLDIELAAGLPASLQTDPGRLLQVLKNLLSNAFKFTPEGEVALRIAPATSGWSADQHALDRAGSVVAFAVTDTGVGIPEDKQRVIFEAFQQADGGTSRQYGGTGLGLSISREIARLLGGEIRLVSQPGQGSTFTLYLPIRHRTATPGTDGGGSDGAPGGAGPAAGSGGSKPTGETGGSARAEPVPGAAAHGTAADEPVAPTTREDAAAAQLATALPATISDDRDRIEAGDRVVLLIEDDVTFARILLERAHQNEFKALIALDGSAGLALARQFKPDAITLDIRLPDTDGWQVLDRLKHDTELRHIPVHVISVEEGLQKALKQGAIACFQKPIESDQLSEVFASMTQFIGRNVKELLIVEDDDTQRRALVELIGNNDVHSTAVGTGGEALAALREGTYECMVLDLRLPDMTGFDLIEKIHQDLGLTQLPIIVYTGKELDPAEESRLRAVAETIIVKDVKSPKRLLDETALFLHRVEADLPEAKRKILKQVHQSDPALAGRKVLIVDDDVRNIFALTTVLERHKMQVVYAENGRAGIDVLGNTPDVDIVLMDIMMPQMDGYEAIRAIRTDAKFKLTPILAVTAKAMKGDREACIAAGASDYITKPVDTEQLLSLLRVWLHR